MILLGADSGVCKWLSLKPVVLILPLVSHFLSPGSRPCLSGWWKLLWEFPCWGNGRGTGLSVVEVWIKVVSLNPNSERLSRRAFFLGYAEIREGIFQGFCRPGEGAGRMLRGGLSERAKHSCASAPGTMTPSGVREPSPVLSHISPDSLSILSSPAFAFPATSPHRLRYWGL